MAATRTACPSQRPLPAACFHRTPRVGLLGNDCRKRQTSTATPAKPGDLLLLFSPSISDFLYVLVALLWIVPDRRIERHLAKLD